MRVNTTIASKVKDPLANISTEPPVDDPYYIGHTQEIPVLSASNPYLKQSDANAPKRLSNGAVAAAFAGVIAALTLVVIMVYEPATEPAVKTERSASSVVAAGGNAVADLGSSADASANPTVNPALLGSGSGSIGMGDLFAQAESGPILSSPSYGWNSGASDDSSDGSYSGGSSTSGGYSDYSDGADYSSGSDLSDYSDYSGSSDYSDYSDNSVTPTAPGATDANGAGDPASDSAESGSVSGGSNATNPGSTPDAGATDTNSSPSSDPSSSAVPNPETDAASTATDSSATSTATDSSASNSSTDALDASSNIAGPVGANTPVESAH